MNPQLLIDQNALYISEAISLNCALGSQPFETLDQLSENGFFHRMLANISQPIKKQMKLLFEDAELSVVAWGQAVRKVPAEDEPTTDTLRRSL